MMDKKSTFLMSEQKHLKKDNREIKLLDKP